MPQVVLMAKHRIKPATVVAVVLAVLVVLGIVAGVLYATWSSQATERYNTAVHDADAQMQDQQYDRAIAIYQDYLGSRPTKDRTYRVQIYVAQVYQQKGDYPQAVTWYQKAESDGTALALVVKPGLAESAQMAGQKVLSIRYYRQSIDLTKNSNSPSKNETVREYEAGITSQGGSVE